MRKMTITEALVQLKLYDSKISDTIARANFVGAKKTSSDKVGTTKIENFEKKAKADYQSVIDLIQNRAAIKAAVVASNATTLVTIAGVTMTVAEAIERKTSIKYDQMLLAWMKQQLAEANNKVVFENNKVDKQIDKMLESFFGKDAANKSRQDENAVANISDPYRKANEFSLVDPIGVEDKIEALQAEVDNFIADVDTKLSISNSVTYIEV